MLATAERQPVHLETPTPAAALREALVQVDEQLQTARVVLATLNERLTTAAPRDLGDLIAKRDRATATLDRLTEQRALLTAQLAAAEVRVEQDQRAAALQRVRALDAERLRVAADLDAALATVRTRLDEWTAKRADLDGAWVAAGLQPRPRHREQFFVRSVLAVSLTEAGLPRDKFLPAESFVQLAEALSLDRKE